MATGSSVSSNPSEQSRPYESHSTQTAQTKKPQSKKNHHTNRLLRCAAVGTLALAGLGRHIIWDTRLSRTPMRQTQDMSGPFNQGEAELRIYCDGKGSALPVDLNTGHCGIAARGNAHLPWMVYETGNDHKGQLFSGTMETHITGRWTPFDDQVISRTQRLTPAQFNTFTRAALEYRQLSQQNRAWTVFHNCAQFAQDLWHRTTGEYLPCQYLPFCTPRLLANAIIDQNNRETTSGKK